jgi:osmotically-inducible protein OsmY
MADNNRNWENQPGRNRQDWDQDREHNERNYDQNQSNENRRSGNMQNMSYGQMYGGNVEQRERETNMARGRGYDRMASNREQRYGGGQYGQGGYAQTGDRYGTSGDYNRQRQDYNRDYENRYGGDTRNYGNANQGGFDNDWWDRTKEKVSSWFGSDSDRGEDANRTRGEHKGKGPRGYTRSDERIKEDVCDRLYDDSYVDASEVEVKVEGSEVILTGTVHSREEKRRAEDLAEAISGVRNVQNQLKVQRSSDDSSTSGYRSSESGRDRW